MNRSVAAPAFVAALLVTAAALATPAAAAERAFDIPAQPTVTALTQFARQADLQIFFPSQAIAQARSPAVKGRMAPRTALDLLIAGSGLVVASDDGRTVMLRMDDGVARQGADAQNVAEAVSDVVVTASRIVRDGYQVPTPTMVLGLEEIRRAAPINLADQINQLPVLAGSTRMNTSTISAAQVGINALNLRNLGSTRTLVLLDGQRMPASTTGGLVDVNSIPTSLVKRVDVVTGGASAAWGSDAVAGVVNFVLDKEFTGVRGEVSGGITTYGDDKNARLALAGGTRFAGGRGHFLVSVEHAWNQGIKGIDRPWYVGAKQLVNPNYTETNGQPRLLTRTHVGYTTVAPGAIVTSGPLRGTYFGAGGVPAQLTYGSIVSDPFMVGGDWKVTDFGNGPQALDNPLSRQNLFARASYSLTDKVEVYGQLSYSRSAIDMITTPQFNFGGLTIKSDNPFLPASTLSQMRQLNLSSLTVGTWNQAIGGLHYQSEKDLYRSVIGASGDFDAFGSAWKWDLFWNRNVSKFKQTLRVPLTANYNRALDAVAGPDGKAMCRSTLTDPTNGCSPLNILGTGVASAEALNYVLGTAWLDATLTQDTAAGSVSGEPFSTWAGPVSVAAGLEYRKEASKGTSDAPSKTNSYWAGNYKPVIGSYDVTEGFLEVAAPLAANLTWAKSLDLNGAVRATDYSSSGSVVTWKLGVTYAPIEDIKIRVTRSRDIRAGNLADLYQPGQTLTSTVTDPALNNRSYTIFYTTIGNATVAPEKADTVNFGVVLQPRFLRGFSASVDYWDIKLTDAISTLGVSTLINQCHSGDTSVCQYIARDSAGQITNVTLKPINLAEQRARGLDYEASYRVALSDISNRLGDGQIVLRALATHYLESSAFSGIVGAVRTSSLGSYSGTPHWRYLTSATYQNGPFSAVLTGRGVSDGVLGTSYIECTSACPTSTTAHTTIDNNHVDGALYFDLALSYKIRPQIETFLSVTNVANKDPAQIPNSTGIGSQQLGVYPLYYDTIGRSFRTGVRFNF